MLRETQHLAIILKKQPLNEADELITAFSKEGGKIRCLAKSVKLPKARLQQALQTLFLVNLRVTNSKLPKIIGAEVMETFSNIRESLTAAKYAIFATELAIKFTADGHPNEGLFNILRDFLNFLNQKNRRPFYSLGLAKFKIAFLEVVGFKINAHSKTAAAQNLVFSNSKGGFTAGYASDGIRVIPGTQEGFVSINNASFSELPGLAHLGNPRELQNLLSRFVEHHLEREVKSEKFLEL